MACIVAALWGCGDASQQAPANLLGACAAEGPVVERPAACEHAFCGAALPSWGTTVAVGDIDGDGLPDLLLGEAGPRVADLRGVVLLRNLGRMRFAPITRCAGLDAWGARAALFADFDNDGDQDLVLGGRERDTVGEGGDVLVFENVATRFTLRRRITAASPGGPTALDVGDLDRDGLTDLIVGRGGTDARAHYPASVYLGRPGLRFVERPGLIDNHGFAWIAAAEDLDEDGTQDLLFLHDLAATHESRAQPGGACADETKPTFARDWRNTAWRNDGDPGTLAVRVSSPGAPFDSPDFTPMGYAAGDFDDDGRRDYLLTTTDVPVLFRGRAIGLSEGAAPPGLRGVAMRAQPGWSALARDLDRDGREDVVMTWGVIPPTRALRGNAVMLGRGGGDFEIAHDTGLERPDRPWSALAMTDLDRDGDDDVVLGAQTMFTRSCDAMGAAEVFENRAPRGGRHWMRLRLVGTVSTRDALGARVEVPLGDRTLVRVVSGAGGTSASGDREVDLGLGDVSRVPSIRVRWPSGAVQRLRNVDADKLLELREPRWLRVTRDGGLVYVAVDTDGLDEVTALRAVRVEVRGDATWVEPFAGHAPTRWRGVLRARGEALIAVHLEGTTVRAARWLP